MITDPLHSLDMETLFLQPTMCKTQLTKHHTNQ